MLHIWPDSSACQSSEGLWLACCQRGKKNSVKVYSYFLGSGHWHFWVWRVPWNDLASCEHWLNIPNGHGGLPNVPGDEGTEREWTVTTAGIKSQLHRGCECVRFQSRQRVCSALSDVMLCVLSFPGWAALAGLRSAAYILIPFGMN